MRRFKDLNSQEQKAVKEFTLERNTTIAGQGLLGLSVKKLAPSKENLKKFQEQFQFSGHPLCGCVGCVELAKVFIDKAPDIKEEIVTESMKDLELIRVK